MTLKEHLTQQEKAFITASLAEHGGDVNAAAVVLGLPRSTLYFRMKRCGLVEGDQRRESPKRRISRFQPQPQ